MLYHQLFIYNHRGMLVPATLTEKLHSHSNGQKLTPRRIQNPLTYYNETLHK